MTRSRSALASQLSSQVANKDAGKQSNLTLVRVKYEPFPLRIGLSFEAQSVRQEPFRREQRVVEVVVYSTISFSHIRFAGQKMRRKRSKKSRERERNKNFFPQVLSSTLLPPRKAETLLFLLSRRGANKQQFSSSFLVWYGEKHFWRPPSRKGREEGDRPPFSHSLTPPCFRPTRP